MKIQMTLNGKKITEEIQPGMLLLDFVRAHGCKSVKRGCETANCGLCTVFVDDKPVLSCSTLVARVSGHKVDPDPSEEEIKEYLAGNLCRCSGYEGQLRGIQQFLAYKKEKEGAVCR